MVSTHFHITNRQNRPIVTITAGISWRLAFGIGIDRYMFNLDIGPLWLGIEW